MPRLRFAILLALVCFAARADAASTFTVTTTSDGADGACNAQCSLRDAVIAANATPGADAIVVPAGTYVLGGAGNEDLAASGDLDLRDSVSITGAGAGATIIDGGGNDRLIDIVESAIVAISDLTLRNGRVAAGDTQGGGAILWNEPVSGKTLVLLLDRVAITGNSAGDGDGGGIHIEQEAPASSSVTIKDSVISGNTMDDGDGGGLHLCCANLGVTITNTTIADNVAVEPMVDGFNGEGGGIHHCCADTTLTIRDSTIRNNVGPAGGGGIFTCCYQSNTQLTVERSTISGNTALGTSPFRGNGGGIEGEGRVTLLNSTLSGNRAFRDGGGLDNDQEVVVMRNVTFAGNEAARGAGFFERGSFYEEGITTTLGNTLFVDNFVTGSGADANCAAVLNVDPLISEGGNLSSDATCPISGTGDQISVDVTLAPLGDYGGPTQTHALPAGSAAVDAGRDTGCQPVDQRGGPRPIDGDDDGSPRCDVGAFERGSAIEDCDNGTDDNANGLVDCFDYDCAGESFCDERCDNCVDDDGDGAVDRADSECATRADGGGSGVADPERAKPLLKCAVALQKAGAKVVRGRTKTLQSCLTGLESCVQKKAGDARCLQSAGANCTKSLPKLGTLDDKARASILKACAPLTLDELRLTSGLGFANEIPACGALDDADAVAACVGAQHACAVERLVALETPRAGELLTLGGLTAADVLRCDPIATAGDGAGLGARGKLLASCDQSIRKAGAKLVAGASALAGGCARRVLACHQQNSADPACITKAQTACGKSAGKLDKLAATLGAAVAKKCAAPTVTIGELLGATGGGFQSRAALCKALGVPTLGDAAAIAECLTRHHTCRAQQVLERELPRLDELLGTGGLTLP
jgi:CSLREA domain-containing protein